MNKEFSYFSGSKQGESAWLITLISYMTLTEPWIYWHYFPPHQLGDHSQSHQSLSFHRTFSALSLTMPLSLSSFRKENRIATRDIKPGPAATTPPITAADFTCRHPTSGRLKVKGQNVGFNEDHREHRLHWGAKCKNSLVFSCWYISKIFS